VSVRNRPIYSRKIAVILAVARSSGVIAAYAVLFAVTLTDVISVLDDASLRQTAKDNLAITDDATQRETAKDILLPTDSAYQNNQNAAEIMGLTDSLQPSSEAKDVVPLTAGANVNFFVLASDNLELTEQPDIDAETPDQPDAEGMNEERGRRGDSDRIVYDESYFVKNPLSRIQVRSFYLQDSQGNAILQLKAGETIDISATVRNYQRVDQTYVYIVQICDGNNVAVAILNSTGTIKSADAADLSISWVPDQAGSFVIKAMVWDEFANPSLFSESVKKVILVSSTQSYSMQSRHVGG
jgi:hypothetical protein